MPQNPHRPPRRLLSLSTSRRFMILRTVALFALGLPEPAGLLQASAVDLSVLPQESAAPAGAEPDGLESVGREFAAWRADLLTRDDGPHVMGELRALVQRAEALLIQDPTDPAASTLVAELYRVEFSESERRSPVGQLRALFLKHLTAVHREARSPLEAALAEASLGIVTQERVEELVVRALDPEGEMDELTASPVGDRRRLGPKAQILSAAVVDAIKAKDEPFIFQLGSSAVEPLRELAGDMGGERLSADALDPLALLSEVDPAAALDVALAQTGTEDLLLKLRVIDAFPAGGPFLRDEVWEPAEGGAFRLLKPEWAGIVTSFYEEPAVPSSLADAFLMRFIERGAAPGELESLVAACIGRQRTSSPGVHAVASSAAERLLTAPDPLARRRGADVLLKSPSARPLWALVEDADPEVRERVAGSFGARKVYPPPYRSATGEVLVAGMAAGEPSMLVPEVDDAYRAALKAFLSAGAGAGRTGPDSDANAKALALSLELSRERGVPVLEPETVRALLSESSVLSGLDFAALVPHLGGFGGKELYGATQLAAKWLLGVDQRGLEPEESARLVQALLAEALKSGSVEALLDAFEGGTEASASVADWTRVIELKRAKTGSTEFSTLIPELSQEAKIRLVKALHRTGYDNFNWFGEDELALHRGGWIELIAHENLGPAGRAWAIKELCDARGGRTPEHAPEVLAEAIAAIGECPVSHDYLVRVGVDTQEMLRCLLDLDGVPDSALLETYIPLGDELAARVLERFPPESWTDHRDAPLLSGLIRSLVGRRDPALNETLLHANHPRSAIQAYLVRAINAERFEGHLPIAGALLKSDALLRDDLIEYVSSFSTDRAARCLIEAMEAAYSKEYRDQLFRALEGMTERRDAADRWSRTRDAEARQAKAIQGLVALIENPAVGDAQRVEALRGLGLLDAREELPRLIGLLESDRKAIRQAAREAIDLMGR